MNKKMFIGLVGLLGLLFAFGTTIAYGNVPLTPPPPEQEPAVPTPPEPAAPVQNGTLSNPPSLPTPPPINEEDVVRELNHAYNEIGLAYNLTNTAKLNGVKVNVQELIDLSTSLYNKAMNYYHSDNYEFAKAYAHLSIESSHMAQEILRRALERNGIALGPPILPP